MSQPVPPLTPEEARTLEQAVRAEFEKKMGAPFPLAVPTELSSTYVTSTGVAVPVMVGTEDAVRDPPVMLGGPRLRARPVGYWFAGYWGHGINSYAFYFVDVGARSRAYFRLSFGGIYTDPVETGRDVVGTLAAWGDLVARLDELGLASVEARMEMDEGWVAGTRPDGSAATIDHPLVAYLGPYYLRPTRRPRVVSPPPAAGGEGGEG